jgi:aminopeptidase YwaD
VTPSRRLFPPLTLLAALLLAVACGGPSSASSISPTLPPASTPLPTTAPSPTAVPASSIVADGARILGYDHQLSVEIGPRPAGSPKEQEAIDFIAGKLRSFGYTVTLQEFPAVSEASREAKLDITAGNARSLTALPMTQSGSGRAQALLVAAGKGSPAEFPPSTAGNVALIERGDLTFQDKVSNAIAAGAAGVVIYNNQDGTFLGGLSQAAPIPVVSISQADGQALLAEATSGQVRVDLSVGSAAAVTAHNIVAKPPGKECETVTGGHYDSVPQAPAASDNGSGTSTVIEIADIIARRGEMGSNCFVLFSGEELGLLGSKAFVASLTAGQQQQLKVMLNFDMVGVGDDYWGLIGSTDWQTRGLDVAAGLGMDARRFQLSGASSDHASFISAGLPALMLYRLTDNLLHTPQDVIDRVRPELLAQAAQFGVNMLESIARD